MDPSSLYLLDEGPVTETTLTRQQALDYYKEMVTIRRMETAAANLYKEKAIRGFCHLCSGQEAVYVGMGAALRDQVIFFVKPFRNTHYIDTLTRVLCNVVLLENQHCERGESGLS